MTSNKRSAGSVAEVIMSSEVLLSTRTSLMLKINTGKWYMQVYLNRDNFSNGGQMAEASISRDWISKHVDAQLGYVLTRRQLTCGVLALCLTDN